MHKYFLLALVLPLCAFGAEKKSTETQGPKMNAATTAEYKAFVANCVDAKDDNPEFDKAVVLESYFKNVCTAFKSGPTPGPNNMKSFLAAAADISELQVMRGECLMNVVGGRSVNAPRTTKGVDMHAALSALANLAGEKMNGYDSPCAPKMCGTDAEAKKIKAACLNFIEWDNYRRMADTMSGAEYSGENKDPAQEIALRGYRAILEQATMNLMMARGHMKLPQLPGAPGSNGDEPTTGGTKKAE